MLPLAVWLGHIRRGSGIATAVVQAEAEVNRARVNLEYTDITSPVDGAAWAFGDADAATVVTGPALDLCRVAGQRASAADTALVATGPDGADVLALFGGGYGYRSGNNILAGGGGAGRTVVVN